MQLQFWLSLALAGLTVARSPVEGVHDIYARSEQDIAAAQDAAAIKKLLKSIDPAVVQLHKTIKGLTAANVGTEMTTLNTQAHTVGRLMESGAAALEKSPPLKGITDAIGLLSPGKTAINNINQTLQDMFAKKEVIKNSGQIPLFEAGLRSLKPGTLALAKAIQSQVPESMKAKMPKTVPGDDKIGPLLDGLFDQVIAVMKGEQEKITVPASLATLIPAKGAGGMAGMPGMADMPAAAEPAPATAAPTVPKAPKGILPKATGLAKNPKGSMGGMAGMSGM